MLVYRNLAGGQSSCGNVRSEVYRQPWLHFLHTSENRTARVALAALVRFPGPALLLSADDTLVLSESLYPAIRKASVQHDYSE